MIFQLFATAPLLSAKSIRACVESLINKPNHDSIFTATEERGWFWCQDLPVNFRPSILPRSQDAVPVVKETTGLYGMRREALQRYHQRIGAKPYIYMVEPEEAMDIDTETDWYMAELVARERKIDTKIFNDLKEVEVLDQLQQGLKVKM